MKRPLLLVALCYVGGLLLAESIHPPLVWLFATAFVLLFPALIWGRARGFLIWPLLLLAGWTNLAWRTTILSPNDLRVIIADEACLATVRGTLAETPSVRVYDQASQEVSRTLVPVTISQVYRNNHWQPASGRIMAITKGSLPPGLYAGREVEITGVLATPPDPIAQGLFDYRKFLIRQGIYYQLKADGARDWRTVDSDPGGPPFTDCFLAWAQQTLARGLPEQDEPLRLMWAMTLGWRTALSGEINEPFMKSGTMHIFAISGLHIALIAGILVSLLRVVRVPRVWCGVVVIPLIWFYTAATGWQPSAVRSTVMMTIVVGGWSLRRPSDLLNSLAAAGFVILLWDPQQLFQASFQLSFFVVLSIALFLPPLERLRDRLFVADPLLAPEAMTAWQRGWRAAARYFSASFVVSLAAWLGSLPLCAFYFHLFSPVTLLANVLIVPMSSAALACNLGSLLCGSWLPWFTEWFNHAGWFWMVCMVKLSRWATDLPGAYYYVAAPSALFFVGYYGLLIGTLSGWLWQPPRRHRSLAAIALVCLFCAGRELVQRRNIELTVLPLSGGHAEFLDAAGTANDWLADCGNTNAFEFVLKPFLHAKGVNQLPRVALTHGDLKHIGAADLLAKDFHPRAIFASSFRFRSVAYRRIFAGLQQETGRLHTVHRDDVVGPWRILHPAAGDESPQGDDGALVRQGEFHGVRVLLLSDLGRAGQDRLLERTPDLRADILVSGIPTHTDALCEALLDAVRPRLIIVADSELPATARASQQLKERLTRRKVTLLHTRDTGAVRISFQPAACVISTADHQHFRLDALPAMTLSPRLPPVEPEE